MKFLVIEGLDGSGKSTQVELIKNFFNNKSKFFEFLHFPIMESKYFGNQIARFLRGEFGKLEDVDPYIVAMMYAGDRFISKNLINNWLNDNKIVVIDRYVYSNIAYQCAKLKTINEQNKLKNWILDLEYNKYKIPKPNLTIFLNVPEKFTKQKLSSQRQGNDRKYLNNKKDIHEENLDFQSNVKKLYLSFANENIDYKIIECADDNGNMLDTESIHQKIIATICEYNFLIWLLSLI